MLRIQDIGFHSRQSPLHGFKIEAGARELGGRRILVAVRFEASWPWLARCACIARVDRYLDQCVRLPP